MASLQTFLFDTGIRTAVGTGLPPSLTAGSRLWEVDRALPLAEDVSPTSTDPPPSRREQPTSFVNSPFYLLDTTVHFCCTFFSNSREFMSENTPNSFTSPVVFA